GDWIKVGEVSGRVVEVRWRSTRIETRNWETVVIPNSQLVRNQFLILGKRSGQPRKWRRWVYFNVDFRTPPPRVIEAVEGAIRGAQLDHVASDPAPSCIMMDLGESTGRYALRYWLTDLAADDPTDSVVRTRIHFALRRAGIALSIPAQAVFMTEETRERSEEKHGSDRERRLAALRQVELFDGLSDGDRDRLAAGLHYAPFARGEVMTRQGAVAHWLYMIIAGEAEVRVSADGGLEREVARLGAGNFFGEMSLLTGLPRTATVVALCEVECYRLDKATFEAIIADRPELAEGLAEILARRQLALAEVREGLDAAAREQLASRKKDLLGRIRGFFNL
ncbi:MAG: cyclic nucleotide-binding domain-containing protein, partial [Acidobacteriota bacterium]